MTDTHSSYNNAVLGCAGAASSLEACLCPTTRLISIQKSVAFEYLAALFILRPAAAIIKNLQPSYSQYDGTIHPFKILQPFLMNLTYDYGWTTVWYSRLLRLLLVTLYEMIIIKSWLISVTDCVIMCSLCQIIRWRSSNNKSEIEENYSVILYYPPIGGFKAHFVSVVTLWDVNEINEEKKKIGIF